MRLWEGMPRSGPPPPHNPTPTPSPTGNSARRLVTSRWPEHRGPSPAVNLQLRGAACCRRRGSARLSACPVPSLGPSLGITGRAGLGWRWGGGVSPHRYPGTDNGAAKEAEGEGSMVGQRSDFGEAHLVTAQQGHAGGTPQPLPPQDLPRAPLRAPGARNSLSPALIAIRWRKWKITALAWGRTEQGNGRGCGAWCVRRSAGE